MTRLCLSAVLVLAATLTLPAQVRDDFGRADWCDESRNSFGPRRSASHCEIRQATLSRQQSIDVDAGVNGGIAVRGWDSADVHVRARVSAYAPSTHSATTEGMITVAGTRVSRAKAVRRSAQRLPLAAPRAIVASM